MDYKELLEKSNLLLGEVNRLTEENSQLKAQLGLTKSETPQISGVSVVFKSNIHQKFAVMDQKVVWYGSINLLSYGSAQESIMRIDSADSLNFDLNLDFLRTSNVWIIISLSLFTFKLNEEPLGCSLFRPNSV